TVTLEQNSGNMAVVLIAYYSIRHKPPEAVSCYSEHVHTRIVVITTASADRCVRASALRSAAVWGWGFRGTSRRSDILDGNRCCRSGRGGIQFVRVGTLSVLRLSTLHA